MFHTTLKDINYRGRRDSAGNFLTRYYSYTGDTIIKSKITPRREHQLTKYIYDPKGNLFNWTGVYTNLSNNNVSFNFLAEFGVYDNHPNLYRYFNADGPWFEFPGELGLREPPELTPRLSINNPDYRHFYANSPPSQDTSYSELEYDYVYNNNGLVSEWSILNEEFRNRLSVYVIGYKRMH